MDARNKRLIGVIAVLIVLNGLVYFFGAESISIRYDERLFAVSDTASVSSIVIDDIVLTRGSGQWQVGDRPADPAFTDHLLNVLLRVRVKKPVGEMDTTDAVRIRVNKEAYYFTSNDTKTRTFFIKDGEGYEVEIPGFSDYVGGIFELLPDQWRDRLVYDGSWRTIQQLQLDYPAREGSNFSMTFEKDFFKMEGINRLDTTVMMDYLNQFQFFQANERLSVGRQPYLDSLKETEPLAILTIDDIQYDAPLQLRIFPRVGEDPFHLWLDADGEMVLVDTRRTSAVLRSRADFELK